MTKSRAYKVESSGEDSSDDSSDEDSSGDESIDARKQLDNCLEGWYEERMGIYSSMAQ